MAVRGVQIAVQTQVESVVFAVYFYPKTWSSGEGGFNCLLTAVILRHRPDANYRFRLESLNGALPPLKRFAGEKGELKAAITGALCAKLECRPEDVRGLKHVLGWFVRGLR